MIYSYLKISIRNLLKHKLFSFVNIFGLAFSLSVCILITMLLADQCSYDRHNSAKDRIYRVTTKYLRSDDPVSHMATAPMPIRSALTENYPGIENSVRFYRGFGNSWIKIVGQDVNIPISGFFSDPEVFDMFEYELLYGNANTALTEPYSVVITKETAERLFSVENPLGLDLKVGTLGSYKVTGVLKETDNKSHIVFDALASISTVPSLVKQEVLPIDLDNWENWTRSWTYLKLSKEKRPEDVLEHLAEINEAQYGENEDIDLKLELQQLTAINPGPLMGNQIGPGLPNFVMYFLIGLALIIVVSTCFNYTNLSIARSMGRAREVGVRKVFGARKSQVFFQFIIEAVVLSLFAFGFAFIILKFLEPAFLQLNIAQLLLLDLNVSWKVYLISLGFSMLIGAIAGFFPSLFHSSVKALQGLNELSGVKLLSKVGLRKTLIVSQFAISLFFIITVITINSQKQFMLKADYGMNTDQIINIRLNGSDKQKLVNELGKYPLVESAAAASFAPATGTTNSAGMQLKPEDEAQTLNYFAVDDQYIDNMKLQLLAGRNFNSSDTDEKKSGEVIVNESTVKALGFENIQNALNEQIIIDEELKVTIIGVIADYNYEPLINRISPMALRFIPEDYGILQVKFNTDDRQASMETVEKAWSAVYPELLIDYSFMSDEIAMMTDFLFGDLTQIITFISMLALVMACLGLLGIAVFSTETKLKEISIRKVLGASEKSILILLSKGFFKLLLLAVLIMTPLALLANNAWLDFVAYRVNLGAGIILGSILIVVTLGLLTVGSQTFFASKTNPVNALRNE